MLGFLSLLHAFFTLYIFETDIVIENMNGTKLRTHKSNKQYICHKTAYSFSLSTFFYKLLYLVL